MKQIKFLIFILLCSKFVFPQNLVLNPSFEERHTNLQFDNNNKYLCDFWFVPNFSTPDYIAIHNGIQEIKQSECLNNLSPNDGNACIGLVLFGWCGGYLEQITGTLSEPLIKDSLYKISFNLQFVGEISLYRIKLIGIKFSKNKKLYPYYIDEFNPFYKDMYREKEKYKADVEINILNTFDTTTWINYEIVYKARGSENFFTFGLFYQSDNIFELKIEKMVNTWTKGSKKEYRFYRRHGSNSFIEISPNIKNKRIQIDQKSHAASYYLIDKVEIVPLK